MKNIQVGRYRKLIIAALGAFAAIGLTVGPAIEDDEISSAEIVLIVTEVLAAFGVYQVENDV